MSGKELLPITPSIGTQEQGSNNFLNQRLVINVNGVTALTPKGKMAHEFLRIDGSLRRHANPRINFAMGQKMVEEYTLRRESLSQQLGMPVNERGRRRRIRRYKKTLTQSGFPPWKILTS